jgi:2-oxoglutarate ferredoxin oxidoreductase subunit gamma
MHEEIIISGFGGQGTLFAGQLLAYAGMDQGYFVTWMPSYGPEMRGGTAHCIVIVSDKPIGSPLIRRPSVAMVLNQPSFDKYEPLLKQDGVLVINHSLIKSESQRRDITSIYVPGNDIANELGDVRMANVVLLGALLAVRPVVTLDAIEQALDDHIPLRRQKIIEPNKKALLAGAEHVGQQMRV